jgi:hypothetical protein
MKIKSWVGGRKAPLIAFVAVVATTALPAAASSAEKGKLTVVHAVPSLSVDVYAKEDLLLEDFKPGTITPPVRLDPADYEIEITPANSTNEVLEGTVRVEGDTDATAVAYLAEDGDPTLGLFNNNQRPIHENNARFTVRHTAAASEVDVRFKRPGGTWRNVTTELMNGEQAKRSLKARTYRFDVVLAGTDNRVLGPTSLKLERRTHYFAYAWGSLADDNLRLNLSTRRLPVIDDYSHRRLGVGS